MRSVLVFEDVVQQVRVDEDKDEKVLFPLAVEPKRVDEVQVK